MALRSHIQIQASHWSTPPPPLTPSPPIPPIPPLHDLFMMNKHWGENQKICLKVMQRFWYAQFVGLKNFKINQKQPKLQLWSNSSMLEKPRPVMLFKIFMFKFCNHHFTHIAASSFAKNPSKLPCTKTEITQLPKRVLSSFALYKTSLLHRLQAQTLHRWSSHHCFGPHSYQWGLCYQQGLPCLVFTSLKSWGYCYILFRHSSGDIYTSSVWK